ncbi:TetR/AcrR family transcriptional regulator [Flavilitoribacter nigricans]|uniref:HTH tetR-type domain-containing protein n=1 Tax=Flavilitoribacter nigricans (strain ATCC 23147 / DSM 23189 / NBRC 102662 / NCIMB 1420 / SS-2) TaxID=1122177 RepID=A0A2D0MYL5_FLAN2|nr:TetR/AcrR family transcriptional regulator [Flavilitoribacter nigricans]PHN01228.1 hypothetical protein CRP01_38125 [Flavilitoribacter nigricans DSM 23189 = NBRC 102662]
MTAKTRRSSKRELILERARSIFTEYGYEKTTLDDIGSECGLNKASLYYYFRNKEEIYVQVLLTEADKYISDLQEKVQDYHTTEEKIFQYLLNRIRRYAEALNVSQLSFSSVQKVEPMFQDLFQKIKNEEIDFLQQLLSEGIRTGDIEEVDAHELAESLFVISDALKHERMIQEKPYHSGVYNYTKVEDQLSMMIRLIFKGLNLN